MTNFKTSMDRITTDESKMGCERSGKAKAYIPSVSRERTTSKIM
jgi:hypothetical protein